MGKYDFDCVIERRGTGAIKVDGLKETFGRDDLQGMWIADMDFAVAPAISGALAERIAHPVYGYPVVTDQYWNSIIDWLRRRHGWEVDRTELTFVPGVVEGIAYAVNCLTSRGDEVVIQPPVYHPFKMVVEGNGRVAVDNPLIADETGYHMDLEGLERIFAERHPRMMILCNPHNPIGIQWDAATLRRVAELAARYGVVVVSDEIHGDLMLNGRRHIPMASVSDEAASVTVTLGAPSKTFNIAGLVSSWCVVKSKPLRDRLFGWLEANKFNCPTMIAMTGTVAAYTQGEDWLDEMLDYIEGNVDATERLLARILPEVTMVRPQASFLLWLDCRRLGKSHDELIDFFINEAKVAMNDGAMFGREGEGFMRLNIGCPRSQVERALTAVATALRK